MGQKVSASRLSEHTFDVLLGKLTQDAEFRKAFFKDPIGSVKELGLELTTSELDELKNLSKVTVEANGDNFREELVLCSSSGY